MSEMRSGFVALVGQPNVGKSTLLNYLLGKKISITSRKPQTTRQRILGIKNSPEAQIVYVDTPGLHQETPREINRYMNRMARVILHDVDVIVFLADARHWDVKDDWVLELLKDIQQPVILALNKIDEVKQRENLLPYLEHVSKKFPFYKIVPISAKTGAQCEELEQEVISCLPEGQPLFPPEQFTDRSDRFMAAEFVREKLLRYLSQELPYSTTVTVDAFADEPKIVRISATIWVERAGQKAIVIGKGGAQLKQIGQTARADMERFFGKQVYLQTWVKVKENWSDDEQSMRQLGYGDE